MTKKDYVKLARVIQHADTLGYESNTLTFIVGELALVLQEDNPRFDRKQFELACKAQVKEGLE